MKTDTYTKVVLTVLAISTSVIAISQINSLVSPAVANSSGVQRVAICRNLHSYDCGDVVGVRR